MSAALSSSAAAAGEIRAALTGLHSAINAAVKQRANNTHRQPLLVAVSKTKPIEAIMHAYAAPVQPVQRHFGENYVQELVEKAASDRLNQDPAHDQHVRWHFIGHLQSNKCKAIARIPNLSLVESVDSVKLATELDKACVSVGRRGRLPVLIQVNTSGEESKFGCEPSEAVQLFAHVLSNCPRLHARGLMTIGRLADSPQPDCFDTLVDIRQQILDAFRGQRDTAATGDDGQPIDAPAVDPLTFEMSMGMSGDFDLAVARGATILRIGSTIFGARDYSKKETGANTDANTNTTTTTT